VEMSHIFVIIYLLSGTMVYSGGDTKAWNHAGRVQQGYSTLKLCEKAIETGIAQDHATWWIRRINRLVAEKHPKSYAQVTHPKASNVECAMIKLPRIG